MHHEVGGAPRSQPLEGGGEQEVERLLADAHRRVGPHGVEGDPRVEATERGIGLDGMCGDVVEPAGGGVACAQLHGSGVRVERPHPCPGGAQGERHGERTPAAAQIGERGGTGVGDCAPGDEEGGALVERTVGEDPRLTGEGAPVSIDDDLDGARSAGSSVAGVGEVVGEVRLGPGGVGHGGNATLVAMVPYDIRVIGDPVLAQRAKEVTEIDGTVAALVDDMFEVMYDAPGVGLAAPQVGVSRRIFVYDSDDRAGVLINPEIVESAGEWEFVEGCLSIPGLHWSVVRPRTVLLRGVDLDGNTVELEATDLEARIFQHELDHLDGVLLVERLTEEQRREAKRALRELTLSAAGPPAGGGLQLP